MNRMKLPENGGVSPFIHFQTRPKFHLAFKLLQDAAEMPRRSDCLKPWKDPARHYQQLGGNAADFIGLEPK